MRDNDDDRQDQGTDGSLADGIGETTGPGEQSSTTDAYGDDSYGDDGYGDDSYDDGTPSDGTTVDETTTDTDGTGPDGSDDGGFGDTETDVDDGGFGDGETGDEVVVDESLDDEVDDGADDGGLVPDGTDGAGAVEGDLLPQDASPGEGIGFILDELHDALFGEDEAASSAFEPDPADFASSTDLDFNADGAVDEADLHEVESSFGVHDHHPDDGGVIGA